MSVHGWHLKRSGDFQFPSVSRSGAEALLEWHEQTQAAVPAANGRAQLTFGRGWSVLENAEAPAFSASAFDHVGSLSAGIPVIPPLASPALRPRGKLPAAVTTPRDRWPTAWLNVPNSLAHPVLVLGGFCQGLSGVACGLQGIVSQNKRLEVVMSGTETTVRVLALLPTRDDQASLNEIFGHSNWNLQFVGGLGQARVMIDDLVPGVVISDCRLPDGCWQDVLYDLQRRKLEPPLIVTSRLADEGLWREVLNLGGYDVLARPFQAQDVFRSVSLAWRHWREEFRTGVRPLARAKVASAAGGLTLAW
jgi:hypothetical protein